MDLTIAAINYNTRRYLRECLESCASESLLESVPILVVDNASSDGSASVVTPWRNHRHLRFVQNAANIGYARAVNQVLRLTESRYVLVTNADTRLRKRSIEKLFEYMEATPQVGVAGGKLLDGEGSLTYSCRRYYTLSALLFRRTFLGSLSPNHRAVREHLMMDWSHDHSRRVDWLQGACMMIRRSAFEQVGGMDEQFFLYFEDVDLCRRMAEQGWEVHYVPDAVLVHHYQRGSYGWGWNRKKAHHAASAVKYAIKRLRASTGARRSSTF